MIIWKIPDIKELPALSIITSKPIEYALESDENYSIAIVGLGPKGLYSLAALQKQLSAKQEWPKLSVHLFNAHPCLAAGPNYNIDQPEFLLINYSIDKISAWKSNELDGIDKLTFIDWLARHQNTSKTPKNGDFASRALVGMYLRDALRVVLRYMPDNVEVKVYQAEVTDCIRVEEGKFRVELKGEPANMHMTYEQIMITTGHSFKPIALTNQTVPGKLIQSVYPVDCKLADIKNHHSVGIAGLGLTFVDTILALTEGRGGKFSLIDNEMSYEPSGEEPGKVIAFSRSGLPMIPRNGFDPKQYSTSSEVLNLLKIVKRKQGSIDFRVELLPIIKLEMENAWFQAIVAGKCQGKDWFKMFNFSDLLDPFKDLNFSSNKDYELAFSELLDNYLEEMESPNNSPLEQVTAVWRNLLPVITEIYNFGGFKGSSLEDFHDNFIGRFNQLSFGPPIISMKKVACLLKSGLLQVVKIDKDGISSKPDGSFTIKASDGYANEVDFLVQASVAKNNFPISTSPLLQGFYDAGLATPYKKDSRVFSWPALDEKGHLISKNGNVIDEITLYGTPSEGMTLDNDSLSRDKNDFASPWAARVQTELNLAKSTVNYEN